MEIILEKILDTVNATHNTGTWIPTSKLSYEGKANTLLIRFNTIEFLKGMPEVLDKIKDPVNREEQREYIEKLRKELPLKEDFKIRKDITLTIFNDIECASRTKMSHKEMEGKEYINAIFPNKKIKEISEVDICDFLNEHQSESNTVKIFLEKDFKEYNEIEIFSKSKSNSHYFLEICFLKEYNK